MYAMIYNITRLNPDNVGDMTTSPLDYFPLRGEKIDINRRSFPTDYHAIIIGGGGLFHPHWLSRLTNIIAHKNGRIVIWGAGLNNHDRITGYPTIIKNCDLIGVRDFGLGYEWVPCASCMHAAFDVKYSVKYEAVIYEHYQQSIPIVGLPRMNNFKKPINEVIKFLGSANTVITTSYHGMYWATLLAKRVLVLPFSSRFMFFKHKPVILKNLNWKIAAKGATIYNDSLKECRIINGVFYNHFLKML